MLILICNKDLTESLEQVQTNEQEENIAIIRLMISEF